MTWPLPSAPELVCGQGSTFLACASYPLTLGCLLQLVLSGWLRCRRGKKKGTCWDLALLMAPTETFPYLFRQGKVIVLHHFVHEFCKGKKTGQDGPGLTFVFSVLTGSACPWHKNDLGILGCLKAPVSAGKSFECWIWAKCPFRTL